MMKVFRRGALAVMAMIAVLLVGASPSFAATSMWYQSQSTTSPTLYQTNLLYRTADFTYPGSTPAAAAVTSIDWQWRMIYAVPSGTTLRVWLCAGSTDNYCTRVNVDSPQYSSGSGNTTAFLNYSARTNFHYSLALVASTTYVLPSPYYPSSFYSVQVNYSY